MLEINANEICNLLLSSFVIASLWFRSKSLTSRSLEENLLVRLVIHEQVDRVIRVAELKGAGDGFVEALSLRRRLAHVVQYSAQLSLTFAGNREGDTRERQSRACEMICRSRAKKNLSQLAYRAPRRLNRTWQFLSLLLSNLTSRVYGGRKIQADVRTRGERETNPTTTSTQAAKTKLGLAK